MLSLCAFDKLSKIAELLFKKNTCPVFLNFDKKTIEIYTSITFDPLFGSFFFSKLKLHYLILNILLFNRKNKCMGFLMYDLRV